MGLMVLAGGRGSWGGGGFWSGAGEKVGSLEWCGGEGGDFGVVWGRSWAGGERMKCGG